MKNMKILAVILATSLILAACRVGPNETMEIDTPQNQMAETFNPEDISDSISPDLPDATDVLEGDNKINSGVNETPPDATVGDQGVFDVPDVEVEPDESDTYNDAQSTDKPEGIDDNDDSIPVPDDYDIEEAEGVMYSTISLNVRRGPSTEFEAFGSLREGQAVEVFGIADGWYLIDYNGEAGFVSGSYMTSEDPNAPEIDLLYPDLTPLPDITISDLCNDYYNYINQVYPLSSIYVLLYYGSYSQGEVVVMDANGGVRDDVEGKVQAGGYEFSIPYDTLELSLHRGDDFISIDKAYDKGYITKEELAQIEYYDKNSKFIWQSAQISNTSDSLSGANIELTEVAKNAVINDYYNYMSGRIPVEDIFVAGYFGTYANGEVVIMDAFGVEHLDNVSTIEVGGYKFVLSSGSLRIMLHMGDTFMDISQAYETGLLTDADLAAIDSVYTNPTGGSEIQTYDR